MNNESQELLTKALAYNLKRLRKFHQITLEGLSEKTGISKLTIGKIEREESNPSISILSKLAEYFNITLSQLLVVPIATKVSCSSQRFKLCDEAGMWELEIIFHEGSDYKSEVYMLHLEAGATYAHEEHTLGSMELAQVIKGSIVISLDQRTYDLSTYDSIQFESCTEHAYYNASDEKAIINITIINPQYN